MYSEQSSKIMQDSSGMVDLPYFVSDGTTETNGEKWKEDDSTWNWGRIAKMVAARL
jgi:hypothetical protein